MCPGPGLWRYVSSISGTRRLLPARTSGQFYIWEDEKIKHENVVHKMDRDGKEKGKRKDGKRRGEGVCEKQREESSAGQLARQVGLVHG